MRDTQNVSSTEIIAPSGVVQRSSLSSSALPGPESIQTHPGNVSRQDAIEVNAPANEPVVPKKTWWKRRWVQVVIILVFLFVTNLAFEFIPTSYVSSSTNGRRVTVWTYGTGVTLRTLDGTTTVESAGWEVVVRGNVVEVGKGRTIPIPDWCEEIEVTMRRGKVDVSFPVRK